MNDSTNPETCAAENYGCPEMGPCVCQSALLRSTANTCRNNLRQDVASCRPRTLRLPGRTHEVPKPNKSHACLLIITPNYLKYLVAGEGFEPPTLGL
jgi:hypothetical protein